MYTRFKTTISMLIIAYIVASLFFLNVSSIQAETFTDLDQCANFTKPAVIYLADKGIISGNNGIFNPNDFLTRAQMVKMLVASMDVDVSNLPAAPSFKDVTPSHWSYPYVEAALKEGIIAMNQQRIFNPNEEATREQMAAMFVRALGVTQEMMLMNQKLDKVSSLKDKKNVSGWASHSVEFSLRNGLMAGVGNGNFEPRHYAQRQQAALVMYNYLMNKDRIMEAKSSFKLGKPFINLGSSVQDVFDILGDEDYYGSYNSYGHNAYTRTFRKHNLSVIFETTMDGIGDGKAKVVGWRASSSDISDRFIMGPKDPKAPPFDIGSTIHDVAKASGTPIMIDTYNYYNHYYNKMEYPDHSVVYFDENKKVVGYINHGSLNVSLGEKDSNAPAVNYKSTVQDVTKALGTPNIVFNDFMIMSTESPYMYINNHPLTYYHYQNSYLAFKDQQLVYLINNDNLRIDFGKKELDFPGITVDSPFEDVVKAMGTPDRISEKHGGPTWEYGDSFVIMQDDKVITWDNKGDLNIRNNDGNKNAPSISAGSSKQDVLFLLGTPDKLSTNEWTYGTTEINIFEGHVWSIKSPIEGILSTKKKDNASPGFTFGAKTDDVIAAIGYPDLVNKEGYKIEYICWNYYGTDSKNPSKVYFDDAGNIVYWLENSFAFKLSQPEQFDANAQPITLGSSRSDVLRVLGTPHLLHSPSKDGIWKYPEGAISFKDDKVIGWNNYNKKLKAFISDPVAGATFTLGSTKSDVIKAMGTPNRIELNTMYFDEGKVSFDSSTQKVVTWWNQQGGLKIVPDTTQSSATVIKIGSTKEDVFKVMGVPRLIETDYEYFWGTVTYWHYGLSRIKFDSGYFVKEWYNIGKNLILE